MKHSNAREQTDLFSNVPAPPALATLQLHHDELVDLINRLLWEVVQGRARMVYRSRFDSRCCACWLECFATTSPASAASACRWEIAMSDKIKPQHLSRKAILYVRQSSAYQVTHNVESQRLQYAVQERLQDAAWMLDRSGHVHAGCCIQATTRDFARFGQFILDGARVDGASIVADGWKRPRTSRRTSARRAAAMATSGGRWTTARSVRSASMASRSSSTRVAG